jgi:hypothetical protein
VRYRNDYVELLRECLSGADDWYKVERCFQEHVDDDDIEDARPVVYAFGYMLVEARRDEIRDRRGIFAPRIEWENGAAFPAPLEEIPDEMLAIWASYAESTADDPVAASRLNDLLWVRRFGDSPVSCAQAAVDAYLALVEVWRDMNLVECASRAVEISAQINDQQRLDRAINKAVTEIEAEMATSEWRPGIPLTLLERLVALKPDSRPTELPNLLDRSAERYGNDPFIAQSVSELRAALSPPEERKQLHEDDVERWRREAEKATGILRYAHLQHALGLARTYGLSDIAGEILQQIQSMSPEELELKRIGTEVSVPREEIDAYVRSLAERTSSWQEAYVQFGVHGPPSGEVKDTEQLVEELAEKHPLTRLIPQQVIGERQSLVFEARSEDQHQRLDLAQQAALRIQFWAPLAVEMLDAITEKFGEPEEREIGEFFATDLIDAEIGARLGDCVLRLLRGDDEGALHVLIPQLEAAIRGLAARAGVVVIKSPQGERPGGVRPLGAILADLQGRMDESWRAYLYNALADPLGVNLRNRIGHGLHGPVSRTDVAIAIHIACHLRLLGAERQGSSDEPPP